jgi:hypothetical protein
MLGRSTTPAMLAILFLAAAVAPRATAAGISAQAWIGRPFGVGRIEIELPDAALPEPLGLAGIGLSEKSGRVFYPALETPPGMPGMVKDILNQSRRPLVRMFSDILTNSGPPKATLYFLFRGDQPLELLLRTKAADAFVTVPAVAPLGIQPQLLAWWRAYTAQPGLLQKKPDYPPVVESYLQSMLARRLDLPPPAPRPGGSWEETFEHQIALTLGTEVARLAIEQQRMLGPAAPAEPANLPLPPPIVPPDLPIPDAPPGVQVEPLAMRVPAVCLYVRFGSFTNFLWFQDTLARWNGDLSNLVAVRGLDQGLSKRMQREIVLQQTALGRLFGEAAVADAAIVGSDAFLGEGAAIGFLFLARNSLLLSNDIVGQRRDAMNANAAVTEKKIPVGKHVISLLTTPDNSIHSFYAVDGDFHFVTSSEKLARRFLETASGEGSLGGSREFRYARSIMPLARNDTVFVYLSDAMFRNMVSPQYRIETARRLAADADIQLVQLARLDSATEGQPDDTFAQLIEGGFLPPQFGPRSDGSRAVMDHGAIYDSLRGAPGTFLPVPDVPVQGVTATEAEAYARFGQYYQEKWGRIDPILLGMQRVALDGGHRERVIVDALMSPLNRQRYDFLMQWLGPPDNSEMAPVTGDQLFVEANLQRQRLFLGLRDFDVPPNFPMRNWVGPEGLLLGLRLRDYVFGYVGAAGPLPLWMALFNGGMSPPDAAGYAASRLGVWRRQWDQFTAFSLQPQVLSAVTPQIRFQQAPRSAQIRVRVGDLSQVQLAPLANRLVYGRSRETALGNLRLIHAMHEQLHVPGEDCKAAAELLVDARLICPLGGQFVYRQTPGGVGYWTTTGLEAVPEAGAIPPGFHAPPLDWFRGLTGDGILSADKISLHAEIDMQLMEKK